MQVELTLLTGGVAVLLALIHLYGYRLRFLDITPRSRWLSLSGGIAIAYVLMDILPELNEAQQTLRSMVTFITLLERHVYLMALAGLIFFYGLEKLAKESRSKNAVHHNQDVGKPGVFWLHVGSFALYNFLIGYLLQHREESGLVNSALYAITMGMHFLVNDYSLRDHYRGLYHKTGRWVLAAAIMIGWAISHRYIVDEALLAVLFALLAGSMILNVLKEELPEERASCYWNFVIGASGYSLLLLTLG